ncbi:enoyl-CoA hydratase/isomerase family protein [Actinomycetospora sp. TBRC 11914]|uniref:enoyl-CoA hydratase/isomerase family protein n=1 Tax=Actinomycetospora sp. TBRC 11914 TaxID=2729387 RepID=UPI00145C9A78|nr:enoyl-CoA hydratase-related protein [Actinomycetospora sp. TBRC 11914]NMO91663.1 enoyl-CoA hydratase/isomerase family protein [Actinomycetospora sp. TBRC 11914]
MALSRPSPGVAEIALTRPELLNRFDAELHAAIIPVLRDLAGDPEVRAVVLSSTGRAFSAGGDFALMTEAHGDPAVRRALVDDARHLVDAFLDLPQPVVAGVQGPAVGLGATVALLCDAVVAARSASLSDTHVTVGLVAGDGGCLVWPAAAGMLRARRHLLTGDPLDAETALTLGLVTDLVDTADEAAPAARGLAARIAALSPLAVQGTKRVLNRVTAQRAGEVLDLSLAHEERTLASDDLLEGISAFREKRPPTFHGR